MIIQLLPTFQNIQSYGAFKCILTLTITTVQEVPLIIYISSRGKQII